MITSGSRDFETGEILVQNGAGRPEIGGGGWGLAGSLERNAFERRRYKALQNNALCRFVSAWFFGDNLRVGCARYGLDCVREADANGDCGLWAAFDYAAEDPSIQASEHSLQGAATKADYAGSQRSLIDSANPAAIAAGSIGEATSVSRDRALIDARNLGPFLRGMAYGVGDGAVGFVDGIKTAVRGVGQYGYLVRVHWAEGADAAAGTSAGQAIDSATVLAIKYGPEVARIIQEIHTGQLSPETLKLIVQVQPLVDEILDAIAEEFNSLSAEEQAELIGRITAATIVEVVAFVGTGCTGAALVIAAKTGKLANITSKLGGFSAKLKNKVSPAIGKFVNKVDEGTPKGVHRIHRRCCGNSSIPNNG